MTTSQQDSPFETTADVDVTRAERYRALFDEVVVAPAKIIANDYRALVGLLIVGAFVFAGTVGVVLVEVPRASDGPRLMAPFVSMEFRSEPTSWGGGFSPNSSTRRPRC